MYVPNLNNVTRFEVIDHTSSGTGRDFVKYGCFVEGQLQDDGKTLKIFLTSRATNETKAPEVTG